MCYDRNNNLELKNRIFTFLKILMFTRQMHFLIHKPARSDMLLHSGSDYRSLLVRPLTLTNFAAFRSKPSVFGALRRQLKVWTISRLINTFGSKKLHRVI